MALNKGGSAAIYSMSCAPAGNCSAGGRCYSDNSGDNQAFVASFKNGIWGKAREVPGTTTLNTGGRAAIYSVSCASARNCSAGGSYAYSSAHVEPFVVGETNGTWGKAEEVPGIAAFNYRYAQIDSVSCASAGSCSAGGVHGQLLPRSGVHRRRELASSRSVGRRYPYSAIQQRHEWMAATTG